MTTRFCKSIGCLESLREESDDFCKACTTSSASHEAANASGYEEEESGHRPSTLKESNPKDAIGSRKTKMSVIPSGVLFDIGNAMTEGMCKYGRHNYRAAGVRSSVYYDASMGHMMDWWEGQDIDAESGVSHVTKAITSLIVLRDAMLQGMLMDDRPPRSKVFKADFSKLTGQIIDRHADKNPHHYTINDKPGVPVED